MMNERQKAMTEQEDEIMGLKELIEAHKQHLGVLREQYATLGIMTPAHIVTEIKRYEREIQRLSIDAEIVPPAASIGKLGEVGMYQLIYAHIMRVDTDIYRLSEQIKRMEDKIDSVLVALVSNRVKGG